MWFRIIDEKGNVYHSRAFGGFYPTKESAERAIRHIDNWRGLKYRVQATKVEWYDVS